MRGTVPKGYFSSPLHRKTELSATFAELRPNHFHSGLDMRIGLNIGEPVYAPADGFVSRIKVSPWGGGKALYIDHPNGYRTVYMHLDDYAGEIGLWVDAYQRARRCYAFDACPNDTIRVKKGQLIAHAGNTGSSGGPHLHFDIRLTMNDQPINPLYFDIPYNDNIKPIIRDIKVYPAQEHSTVNGLNKAASLCGKKGWAVGADVSGPCYVGIYATDAAEGTPGKNGVERMELFVDDTLFCTYEVQTFLFEETRAVNAIMDYTEYRRSGRAYVLSRVLRGNGNNFVVAKRNRGYLRFGDGKRHKLLCKVYDEKGNMATRTFYLNDKGPWRGGTDDDGAATGAIERKGTAVSYFKRNRLQYAGFEADLEEGTLYDHDLMLYATSRCTNLVTPLHSLQPLRNPLPPHKAFRVRVMLPQEGDTSLRKSMVVVRFNGNRLAALPTTRHGLWLEARSDDFGGFGIAADTIPPSMISVNILDGMPCQAHSTLQVKISDDLSGLETYDCYVNGDWTPAAFHGPKGTLTVKPGTALKKGNNEVRFVVSDMAGNKTTQTFTVKH
ncbi:MAG: peptidoglycan DD-metalloendopeptidase family protein [Bacteroidales bacterium]|nr:peptidoglycan DD-metalloendopeptidase family protein [Bacteroidales bacterium]